MQRKKVDPNIVRYVFVQIAKFSEKYNRGPITSELAAGLGLNRTAVRAVASTGLIVARRRTLNNGQIINEWHPAKFKPRAFILWWAIRVGRWFSSIAKRFRR